jgi:hypothetical protein
MYEGTLIMESLRVETTLDVSITCRRISRIKPAGTTQDQAPIWTLIDFEVADDNVEPLAQALSDALDQPGWYADFRSDTESWVIFPGRTFTYHRGDSIGRAEAADYGRRLNIPEPQLDWPV